MTAYEKWESEAPISAVSPEAFWSEQAWNAGLSELIKYLNGMSTKTKSITLISKLAKSLKTPLKPIF